MLKNVNDCGYIIPFKKALQNYLNQPEVWEEASQGHSSTDDLWEDFCGGTFVK